MKYIDTSAFINYYVVSVVRLPGSVESEDERTSPWSAVKTGWTRKESFAAMMWESWRETWIRWRPWVEGGGELIRLHRFEPDRTT